MGVLLLHLVLLLLRPTAAAIGVMEAAHQPRERKARLPIQRSITGRRALASRPRAVLDEEALLETFFIFVSSTQIRNVFRTNTVKATWILHEIRYLPFFRSRVDDAERLYPYSRDNVSDTYFQMHLVLTYKYIVHVISNTSEMYFQKKS